MINEKEIQKHISSILRENGFNTVAAEITEGFRKPAVFVNVYPATITLLSAGMEEVSDTVEIRYIPEVETVEECSDTAQRLRSVFMYKPLCIKDRRLTVQSIEFDIEKYVLYAYFDLQYIQETPEDKEYEEMSVLKLGGNINGITGDIN